LPLGEYLRKARRIGPAADDGGHDMVPERPRTAVNGRPAAGGLTPKQEQAALALAAGSTERQAARKAGAGERTLRTWLADQPAFARRVTQLRGEMTSRALGRLADAMVEAADTLRELLKAKGEQTRLLAARSVLELATKLRDSVELEARMRALEDRA
jgi:hypothetical protein